VTAPAVTRPVQPGHGPEPKAHKLGVVHPRPIQGCPWCAQPDLCQWCDLPRDARPDRQDVCPDWDGHGDLYRGSEITYWRAV
jgi:hypothetical protein